MLALEQARLEQARRALRMVRGLVDIGYGLPAEGPRRPGWLVYVEEEAFADARTSVPGEVGGISTHIVVHRRGETTSGAPTGLFTPGMDIETNHEAEGALGCFAQAAGDATQMLLLSAGHVLFGDGFGATGIKIYQPPSSSSWCRHTHIGTTRGNWQDGFHGVRVRVHRTGEPDETLEGFETDAAVARLVGGLRFTNEIPGGIGMIQGTPSAGDLGVVVGPPFGQVPQPNQLVRFYSPVQKAVRWGTIASIPDITADYLAGGSGPVPPPLVPERLSSLLDEFEDAAPNINMLLVIPRPPPPTNPSTTFADYYAPYLQSGGPGVWFGVPGDSGSIVVNHENKAIGLMARAGPGSPIDKTQPEGRAARSFGLLCPIGKVLSQLHIEIPPNFANTTPSAGPLMPIDVDAVALDEGIDRVRAALRQTPAGSLLLSKLDRHGREGRRLINRVRRVTVAWHRNEGPAFLHHGLESLRDPEHRIPRSINAIEWSQLVERMAEAFSVAGSDELRGDIERYLPLFREHLSVVSRLDDVPRILADVSVPDEGTLAGAAGVRM